MYYSYLYKRYVDGKPIYPNQTMGRHEEVAKGRPLFAVIIGCSNSRVPPEIIFDRGLGNLFVVRVTGNIVYDVVKNLAFRFLSGS